MLIGRLDHKSLFAGAIAALVVVAGVWLGSQRRKHFDPALIWYATGSVLAAFAVAYRFAVWAQRPPSRLYFKRGLELFFKHHGTSVPRITPHVSRRNALTFQRVNDFTPASGGWTAVRAFATGFVAQNFIRRRSVYRWIMHLCLSGGCTLAFAITFPLVFGWVHFEPSGDNAEIYRVNLLGFDAGSFGVRGALAFVVFNLLNLCAVAVTAGLVMAAIRRCVNAGERAVQTFSGDILPLLLIFFVTSTGLMLTVSYRFMAGRGHSAVAVAHAGSVRAAGALPRLRRRLRVADAPRRLERGARSTRLQLPLRHVPRRGSLSGHLSRLPPAPAGVEPGQNAGALTGLHENRIPHRHGRRDLPGEPSHCRRAGVCGGDGGHRHAFSFSDEQLGAHRRGSGGETQAPGHWRTRPAALLHVRHEYGRFSQRDSSRLHRIRHRRGRTRRRAAREKDCE